RGWRCWRRNRPGAGPLSAPRGFVREEVAPHEHALRFAIALRLYILFSAGWVIRLLLLIAISLASVITPAVAADLPIKSPLNYYPPDIWSSTYFGVGGVASAGKFHGPFGTLTLGINFQPYSRFVLGVETDLSGGNLTTNAVCAACDVKSRWAATARGRIGYTFDRALLFVTGGFAAGEIKTAGPGVIGSSTWRTGFAVGGGAEFALNSNWSLRADYLHEDFGSISCGPLCAGSAIKVTSDNVQARLIYRFFHDAVREYNVLGPPIKPPPFDD